MEWMKGKLDEVKKSVSQKISSASETVSSFDLKETTSNLVDTALTAVEKTKEAGINAYDKTKDNVNSTTRAVTDALSNYNYSELGKAEFYSRNISHYLDLSTTKITEVYRSTFEVDKKTIDMVDDIRKKLPVPAQTVDDIFEQCKQEAMKRAVSAFALSSVLQDVDNHSAEKYDNLSVRYSSFSKENAYQIKSAEPFAKMVNERNDASVKAQFLDNGYNAASALDPARADIEHVVSKKELYVDPLIRIGTTNEQYFDLINSPENLVFADRSVNRSMGAQDVLTYLEKRGTPIEGQPDRLSITITQKGGATETIEVNKKDMIDAYTRANEKRNEHRLAALQEVGQTVALTGATMAAQQIVGLIVVETIDIFVDEIQLLAKKGQLINNDGWIKNSKDAVNRINTRLAERFEEKRIWERAKALGLEAGVAGALSVIPQILISLIVKMPSFILGLIRECTLSVVRCVRVLLSDDPDKLNSIIILLAGAASAIAGLYVGRVVSTAISGVPLLNQFNSAITTIITGVVVTAVPLAAIYTFEQNKNKLIFSVKALKSEKNMPDIDDNIPA